MDSCKWDKSRFDEIKQKVETFIKSIGFPKSSFVPISGLTGEGVCQPAPCSWYSGENLIEHFEKITLPDRTALRQRPLRATVLEYGTDSKGVTLRVRLECGKVAVGDKIRICPTMNDAIVNDIIEPPGLKVSVKIGYYIEKKVNKSMLIIGTHCSRHSRNKSSRCSTR